MLSSNKSKLFIALFLFSTLQLSLSTPTYTKLYSDAYLNLPPQDYYAGNYYTGSASYNPSTDTIANIGNLGNCTGGVRVTSNFQFWCLGSNNGQYSLNQINPQFTQVIATYPVTSIGTTSVDYIYVSGTYLILAKLNQQTGATTVNFFDTLKREYVCTTATVNPYFLLGTQWFTGYGFLYTTQNTNKEILLSFEPCVADQPFSVNVGKVYSQFNFIPLNYSSVFLHYYNELVNGQAEYYVQPFYNDLENNLVLGSQYPLKEVTAVSNTTIFGTYSTNGYFSCGLFVVNPYLQLVQVHGYVSPINSTTLRANAIYGSTQVVVDVGGGQMIYDLSLGKIVNATGTQVPIVFANGTVVNVTKYGYFIQNPGQSIEFVYLPNQATFQSLSDPTQLWTFFIPSVGNYFYQTCTLLYIKGSQNLIQRYTFNQCPISSGAPIIEDVGLDSSQNVHLAYSDSNLNLYVLTQSASYGPYSLLQGYPNHKVSISTSSSVGWFIGTPSTTAAGNLNVTTFNTATGAITNTVNVVGNYYTLSKLNGQYFVAGVVNGSAINFETINGASGGILTSNRVGIANTPGMNINFFPLGITGPTTYTGLVVATENVNVYLVGASGSLVHVSFTETYQRNIYPAGSNTFFIKENEYIVTYLKLYQVTGWTEVRENNKFLGNLLY